MRMSNNLANAIFNRNRKEHHFIGKCWLYARVHALFMCFANIKDVQDWNVYIYSLAICLHTCPINSSSFCSLNELVNMQHNHHVSIVVSMSKIQKLECILIGMQTFCKKVLILWYFITIYRTKSRSKHLNFEKNCKSEQSIVYPNEWKYNLYEAVVILLK